MFFIRLIRFIKFCITAYIFWTFTWFVHFEPPFRPKGTDKIHTEGLSKFHSNIYSILFIWDILKKPVYPSNPSLNPVFEV